MGKGKLTLAGHLTKCDKKVVYYVAYCMAYYVANYAISL